MSIIARITKSLRDYLNEIDPVRCKEIDKEYLSELLRIKEAGILNYIDSDMANLMLEIIDNAKDAEKENDEQVELINMASNLCTKFVYKVETGRARSKETYSDCKRWLQKYNEIYKIKEGAQNGRD